MIAGASLFGVSWNDCAPINMAMYSRMGEIATTGTSDTITEITPSHDSRITMMPVAAE